MIRVDSAARTFGEVSVLEDIDLRVDPGEFVALVGPNGAGKTTLLRVINGLLDPDEGEVTLDGDPLSELSSRAVSRRLATVPQDTHVGFSFRAEEIIEMGRTPHRSRLDWSDDGDPVEAALERTETTHLRDRRVDDLSGGERQRVLLARALAQEPDALLLDEPTASLDINHQVRVLNLVADLVEEGRAALAAIHDLDLAARFCDRLVLLHDGTIAAQGPPETVLRDSQLADAFETETAVTRNPVTGTPTVAALSDRPDRDSHVHVAGGGEPGVEAVRSLWKAGFDVTAGPVPAGDAVVSLCDQLYIEVTTAPAFRQPGEALDDALTNARAAEAVVVTDGPGGQLVAEATDSTVQVRAEGHGSVAARVDGGRVDDTAVPALVTAVTEQLDGGIRSNSPGKNAPHK
ncbi:iron complex transport system ATP-binding protein [Halovenus aranensis]|uniref:Cobalamin import ATP-binding protein BtuD n=1 Tax=Halovenus aranensis TaxID=890420 RepID=A0A1G8U7C5_9EURY|nr:heme ABC transporter ATP-binding protein [Halovenus aranensis]SDJ49623.1 iron complex transport system ATP-binding protein [Halovenus aranensis]